MSFEEFEKKVDMRGPLEQAERCLIQWLAMEQLSLDPSSRRQAAALMARYFLCEDQVTDALLLSFLGHYTQHQKPKGFDMDDPVSVRRELKTVLDRAQHPDRQNRQRYVIGAAMLGLALMISWGVWLQWQRPINTAQQAELRALVHEIAARDTTRTTTSIWKEVKAPLGVDRYQDIPARYYAQSRAQLEARLATLQNNLIPSAGVRARIDRQ